MWACACACRKPGLLWLISTLRTPQTVPRLLWRLAVVGASPRCGGADMGVLHLTYPDFLEAVVRLAFLSCTMFTVPGFFSQRPSDSSVASQVPTDSTLGAAVASFLPVIFGGLQQVLRPDNDVVGPPSVHDAWRLRGSHEDIPSGAPVKR
jgi:hypothetical protein